MGNQLTGIAPSQIQPVEQYLTEVSDCEYDGSLGSTRFFKVARATGKEGYLVVKVFVIHDPSLPLASHKDRLEELRSRLQGASNCLPFQMALSSSQALVEAGNTICSLDEGNILALRSQHLDRAALLFRQFVKDSLYDRISTRPFLNLVEKKWIAFQLLCALNQSHKLKVYHGDIKSENVMITSWNWVLLTDFASFKPTYIPEDNPSDFNYFFDTSRRRTCYIAPERFVETGFKNLEVTGQTNHLDITGGEIKTGELTSAMDIFSTGCVIAELFTEGTAPFDLSQLLAYRSGEYSPWKILEKIEDVPMRELIRHMMQREPSHRLSAEEYLIQQRGKVFPEYFYTFLKLYLQRFAMIPIVPPDDRVGRISRDLLNILSWMNINPDHPEDNTGLVLIISLVTSCVRKLHYCSTKLVSLDLLLELSSHMTADIIVDRILPYMLYFVNDQFPRVRAAALRTITKCLAGLKSVPRTDANIFPEYILPNLSHLTQDPVPLVRVAYAESIAQLAETALSVLEMMHIKEMTCGEDSLEDNPAAPQYQTNYDVELQTLHEMIQQKVVTLLSDPDNIVKQTLLESGITRLCVFFGRQKANDVLLSHMITFLNDKLDWHLRGSFFDNIIGVAAYVGWQSSTIMKPLLQQGLNDPEEFVVHKALGTLTSLTELSLVQKPLLYDFVKDVVPLLAHPGVWIRQGAVGFMSAVARMLNIADVHCRLLPQIQPFLKQPILQLDKEVVLLNSLQEPISRPIFDYVLRSVNIDRLFSALQERSHMRQISRHGHKPAYEEMDEGMALTFRKLTSQGMTEAQEDRLLALKDFILKIQRARAGSAESKVDSKLDERNGAVDLYQIFKINVRRHAELHKPKDTSVRKKKKPDAVETTGTMNPEWKSMFGSSSHSSVERALSSSPKGRIKGPMLGDKGSQDGSLGVLSSTSLSGLSSLQSSSESFKRQPTLPEKTGPQTRYAVCKLELRNLVYKKREQYTADVLSKDLLEGIAWDSRPPPTNWRPKGMLVAHMQEHRAAVNRIQVSCDHTCFATCSNDGTVKVWDCSRFEGKSVANRSRQTYNKQGGQVKCLTYCEESASLASASDNGTIHVFRIETGANTYKLNTCDIFDVGTDDNGHVVDLTHFDTGAQSVLTSATVNGYLLAWDLRARDQPIWKLKNDPKCGLITSLAVHHTQSWLCVGTSSGAQVCWDMRFQLPITTVQHPTNAWVRRVAIHPREQSWVVSSVQGNNEVSIWDMETGARQKTLWASSAPALSQTQMSNHSTQGMHVGHTDSNVFLLTGGTDMRVRFWDLTAPQNSFVMAGAAGDTSSQTDIKYRMKVIDGTEVIQEFYTKKNAGNDDIPRRAPDAPALGHHDTISDVGVCQATQCFVISASRDGVVKVWK